MPRAAKGPGASLAVAVFYGALAALVLLGVRDVLFLYEENRCSMTYMFEYPEYLVSPRAAPVGGLPVHPLSKCCAGCRRLRAALLLPSCFLPTQRRSWRCLKGLSGVVLACPPCTCKCED